MEVRVFPCAYEDSTYDQFWGTYDYGSTHYNRGGHIIVQALGYGTLKLPSATISNVLLVKETIDYGDSLSGAEVFHYLDESYVFLTPGVHTWLLALIHSEGGVTSNTGFYLDDPALGIQDETTGSFSVYPNPVQNELTISFGNDAPKIDQIKICNISGSLVYTSETSFNSIDISSLDPGIYYLDIQYGEDHVVKKFVKK